MDDSVESGASWLAAAAAERAEANGALSDIEITTDEGKPRAQAAVLIDIGRTHKLFHEDDDPYARVGGGSFAIPSAAYREILGRDYYKLTGKGANRNALADAVCTLSAIAKCDGPEQPVYLRVGEHEGGVVIDSGDAQWSAYHVTAADWTHVNSAPVNFRRSGKPLSLPRPTDADFPKLWGHINVAEEHRVLVAAWLLAALRPRGPYPILTMVAGHGAGKSTTTRILKSLTDPSAAPLRKSPKNEEDLLVAALSSRVLALDNLSGLDHLMSDALCRISTGGALSGRKLYTNAEEVLIEVQRPMILHGIEDLASRPDLADRCVQIIMPWIPESERAAEEAAKATFARDAGCIFAGLLDGLALAIRDVDRVRFDRLPRMADFALWAAAGLPALGFTAKEFMEAYRRNRDEATEAGLEASPVGNAIRSFISDRGEWTGTAADLLDSLGSVARDNRNTKAWPQSPKGLINALRRLEPALRHVGIYWRQTRAAARNLITLSCNVGKQVPQAPQVPQTQAQQGFPAKPQVLLSSTQAPQAPHLSSTRKSLSSTSSTKFHTKTRASTGVVELVEDVELKSLPCTMDGDDGYEEGEI